MSEKPIEEYSFEELKKTCIRRLFDALLTGGSQNMDTEFHNTYSIICQWQGKNVIGGDKKR